MSCRISIAARFSLGVKSLNKDVLEYPRLRNRIKAVYKFIKPNVLRTIYKIVRVPMTRAF